MGLPADALFRSTLPPVLVVGICLLAMVPTGARAFLPVDTDELKSKRQLRRRVFTGCMLGATVSLWIFSGTWSFLAVFAWMAVVAQNEYYYMARQNGVYPTWKLGLLGSISMYIAACSGDPIVRDAMFPLVGSIIIIYLLLRQEKNTPPTTMNDVATTFMGIYYFGYMPSFWIRLRCLGVMAPSRVLGLFLPATTVASAPLQLAERMGVDFFSIGALVQWWTMVSIVSADVAAYFAGKRWGATPLIKISPKKTWEGLLGGCLASMLCSALGATLMGWPLPILSGVLYGLLCAMMALVGDLTISLLKRSAGVKDTGRLLPGHGGLLDRLDSYLLVSAPAYFFIKFVLDRMRVLA